MATIILTYRTMSNYNKKFSIKTEKGTNTIVSRPFSVDATDIQSEETLSIEQVLDVGQDVFNFIQEERARLEPKTDQDKRAILKSAQDRFPKFRRDYPIVIRWAVFEEEYYPEALRHYIKKCFKVRYDTKSEFAEGQAEYVVAIQRMKNKRLGGKDLQKVRANIVRVMLKEEKDFNKAVEEAKEECERLEKADNNSRRVRLQKYIENQQKNGKLLPDATGNSEGDSDAKEICGSEPREPTPSAKSD